MILPNNKPSIDTIFEEARALQDRLQRDFPEFAAVLNQGSEIEFLEAQKRWPEANSLAAEIGILLARAKSIVDPYNLEK